MGSPPNLQWSISGLPEAGSLLMPLPALREQITAHLIQPGLQNRKRGGFGSEVLALGPPSVSGVEASTPADLLG